MESLNKNPIIKSILIAKIDKEFNVLIWIIYQMLYAIWEKETGYQLH